VQTVGPVYPSPKKTDAIKSSLTSKKFKWSHTSALTILSLLWARRSSGGDWCRSRGFGGWDRGGRRGGASTGTDSSSDCARFNIDTAPVPVLGRIPVGDAQDTNMEVGRVCGGGRCCVLEDLYERASICGSPETNSLSRELYNDLSVVIRV